MLILQFYLYKKKEKLTFKFRYKELKFNSQIKYKKRVFQKEK